MLCSDSVSEWDLWNALSYNENSDLKSKGFGPPAYFSTMGYIVARQRINNCCFSFIIVIEGSKCRSSLSSSCSDVRNPQSQLRLVFYKACNKFSGELSPETSD